MRLEAVEPWSRSPWWFSFGTKARAGKNEVTYINGFPVGVGDSQRAGEFWIQICSTSRHVFLQIT